MSLQGVGTEDEYVIQTFPTNRSDYPFNVRPLPRRARCRQRLLDSKRVDLFAEGAAVYSIAIAQEVSRSAVPGERLAELLSCPLRFRMLRHCEVHDPPSIMCQDEKHV